MSAAVLWHLGGALFIILESVCDRIILSVSVSYTSVLLSRLLTEAALERIFHPSCSEEMNK